jgi:hypothetical protein
VQATAFANSCGITDDIAPTVALVDLSLFRAELPNWHNDCSSELW